MSYIHTPNSYERLILYIHIYIYMCVCVCIHIYARFWLFACNAYANKGSKTTVELLFLEKISYLHELVVWRSHECRIGKMTGDLHACTNVHIILKKYRRQKKIQAFPLNWRKMFLVGFMHRGGWWDADICANWPSYLCMTRFQVC